MRNREWKARRTRAVVRGRQRPQPGRLSARGGFTLIELTVAIMILVVGVLGLAGTAGMVSRMVGGAAQQTVAANVASSRFEKLRSVPCAQVTSGTATTRNINEKWTVRQEDTKLFDVKNDISYMAAGGRSRTLTFQSYVLCK